MDSFNDLYNACKKTTFDIDKNIKHSIVQYIKATPSCHDDIYIIIRMFYDRENIKYNMKELKNGNIKMNIDTIHPVLQHILYEYIKMNKIRNSKE